MQIRVLALLAALIVAGAPVAVEACAIACAGTPAAASADHACHHQTGEGLRVAASAHACGHDTDDELMPTVGVSRDVDAALGPADTSASSLVWMSLTRSLALPSRLASRGSTLALQLAAALRI